MPKRPERIQPFVRTSGLPECPLGRLVAVGIDINSGGVAGPPTPMRPWSRFAIVLTLKGRGIYLDSTGKEYRLEPGVVFFLLPGVSHAYWPAPGHTWDQFFLDFEGPIFDLCHQRGVLDLSNRLFLLRPLSKWVKQMHSIYAGAAFSVDQSAVRMARLLELIVAMQAHPLDKSAQGSERAWQAEAMRLLTGESLEESEPQRVAARLNMSYETFRKRFTKAYGVAPGHYRTKRLIRRACELLRNTDLSSKEIAHQLGFGDEYYFSRAFKKAMGIPPRAFRRDANWRELI